MAGTVTLADWAMVEKDTLRKSVLDTLVLESDVAASLPMETTPGSSLATTITMFNTLPTVGTRKVNAAYSQSQGDYQQKVELVSLFGLNIDTDKAIVRSKNSIAAARASQQTMALKAVAFKFNDEFINGDPEEDPEVFKGCYQRIGDIVADGYTGQYIDNAGTSGDGILLNSAERHNFLDKFDEAKYAIGGHKPDFAFMNSTLLLAIRSGFRREGLFSQEKDQFDRVVDMHGGTKLVDIGTTADGTTEIMPNTETLEDAGAAESTSIVFVKFEIDMYFWGIQQYPLEVTDKGELEDGVTYRTVIDWPLGLAHASPYSMSRLYAIIPNAST